MRAKDTVAASALALGMALSTVAAAAQGNADAQLGKVLAQMDAASAKFSSAQAEFSWDQYTAVVQDHDVQKGSIAFRRAGAGVEMVVHVLTENGQPAPKDVLYKDGQLDLFQPQIHQETVLSAGKDQGQFESYATLGFGGSGKSLQQQWNVQYEGSDTIDGTAVAKLMLTPRNAGPNPMFSHIEIWLDPVTDTSRKQVFSTPGGDTRTALYSAIKMNSTGEGAFRLKLPPKTQVIHK